MLRVSSLLSPLNAASVNIVDDEGSCQFSPKAELTSPLRQTLKQNHCATKNWYSVKNVEKAFKCLLNKLMTEKK